MFKVFRLLNPFIDREKRLGYYLDHCRTTISLLSTPQERTDFVFGDMLPTLEKSFRKKTEEALDIILDVLDGK